MKRHAQMTTIHIQARRLVVIANVVGVELTLRVVAPTVADVVVHKTQ